MADSIPVDRNRGPLCTRPERKNHWQRLRTNDDCPILFSDSRINHGHFDASPPRDDAGQISFLAELIRPFAKDRAERIAERLVKEFGGLGNAMEATPQRLSVVIPNDDDVWSLLIAARRLVHAGLRERIERKPVDVSSQELHQYLRCTLGNSSEERFVAIYLGHNLQYLSDEIVGIGSIATVRICTRQIIRRALDLGAHAFILAHNHPSGNSGPSQADIDGTDQILKTATALQILLVDHLVVTSSTAFSIRESRLL